MGTIPDLNELTTKLENTLLSYHSLEEKEWTLAKKWKDITAWRKPSSEFNGYLFKVQGLVMEKTQRIVDFIRPGPCRLEWDSLVTSLDIVETLDEKCCVARYVTAGQLLNIISPREFVDLSYTTKYQNGLLSCGVSLPYEQQYPSCVHGFNHPCGWFCVPVDESQSLLTGYIQTDLRGLIPQTAVDTAMASSLGNFIVELRAALKK